MLRPGRSPTPSDLGHLLIRPRPTGLEATTNLPMIQVRQRRLAEQGSPTMNERTSNAAGGGFSLVTGLGRAPMTRHQVHALGRVIGTVPQPNRGR